MIPGIITAASKPKVRRPISSKSLQSSSSPALKHSVPSWRLINLNIPSPFPQHKATHICVMCKSCQNTKMIPCKAGIGGAVIPRTCDAQAVAGGLGVDCGVDPYIVKPSRRVNNVSRRLLPFARSLEKLWPFTPNSNPPSLVDPPSQEPLC